MNEIKRLQGKIPNCPECPCALDCEVSLDSGRGGSECRENLMDWLAQQNRVDFTEFTM